MLRIQRSYARRLAAVPAPTVIRPESVASIRAALASELEDLFDAVWQQERWAREEDRLDRAVRVA